MSGEGGWDCGGVAGMGLGCVWEVKSAGLADGLEVLSGGDERDGGRDASW